MRLISTGFFTVNLKEELPAESSRIISSCWIISCACSTQFSQICPSCPAMRILTSSRLRPQKEQCKVFFAILQSYPTYSILPVCEKKQSRKLRDRLYGKYLLLASNQYVTLNLVGDMVYNAVFDGFFRIHPVIPVKILQNLLYFLPTIVRE